MAQTETLANLRTRARRLADMVGSTFVTDAELTDYANNSYSELYDLLCDLDYYESTQTITSTGVASVALPAGYRSTKIVTRQMTDGTEYILKPIPIQEKHLYTLNGSVGNSIKYRIAGSNIIFYPTPRTGEVYLHTYVPALTKLSADGDTLDGVSGWEDYIVVDMAIQCRIKEESSVVDLTERKEKIKERIEYQRANRNLTEIGRVVDSDENGSGDAWSMVPYNDRWWGV